MAPGGCKTRRHQDEFHCSIVAEDEAANKGHPHFVREPPTAATPGTNVIYEHSREATTPGAGNGSPRSMKPH